MEIVKVEECNYSIIYVNDNDHYYVYRRFNETTWQIFHKNKWNDISRPANLEELLKNKKSYEESKMHK